MCRSTWNEDARCEAGKETNEPMGELLMIAGGGTGGHIYPAIAVAREFVSRDASRSVVFVGTPYGLEKDLVPRAGFPIEFLRVGALKGKSLAVTVRNLARLPLSFVSAWKLLGRYRPIAVLGVGGYASGPLVLMAALRRIPTMIQEQNAFPGITNRILARVVREVAVAFSEASSRLGREGRLTGNPIRTEFFELGEIERPEESERRRLLIFGGSQGSRILNETMMVALMFLARLKDRLTIVHQTGRADHERVSEAYRASAFPEARVVPFLDEMAQEMADADFVLCRAGAITIAELAAVGRASILVPFALAADNHQELNARAMESAGGAIVIPERDLTPERLASVITELAADPERSRRMGREARGLAQPDATGTLVDILEEIGGIN